MFPQSPRFLPLTIGMIICLLLLINISYKIVEINGILFSANCLIFPVFALLYSLVLRYCTLIEQRNVLNLCLMALYAFPVSVFILTHLPNANEMYNNQVYHIVFEDIPKKFFAATLGFLCCIYIPHWVYRIKFPALDFKGWMTALLPMLGGFLYFILNFNLLFINLTFRNFQPEIFHNSLKICLGLQLAAGLIHLFQRNSKKADVANNTSNNNENFPFYESLICIGVVLLMICMVCQYRLVVFMKDCSISASSFLFPLIIIIGNIIGEIFGYRANLRFTAILVITGFIFDSLLMALVILPSPEFFDINPFYCFMIPRRLPAVCLILLGAFLTNTVLLKYLGHSSLSFQRSTRMVIANVCAISVLCILSYSMLFSGIYGYNEILNFTLNAWVFKIAAILFALPAVLYFIQRVESR